MTKNVSSRRLYDLLVNDLHSVMMNTPNIEIPNDIPTSWEVYGDLVVFRDMFFKDTVWYQYGDRIWETVCKTFNVKRIGLKGNIINDDFRTPKIKIVYGDPGWVELIDNGIRYSWDCEKSMFCRGNLPERHRIAKLDCQRETVVDLFAGIGYFTLPYLVHARAAHVHACEWNPYAISALRQNLTLNKVVDRCTIHEGDNRLSGLSDIGFRINVGIIPSSVDFWPTACRALLSTGGILYIHENITSDIPEKKIDCDECDSLKQRIACIQNEMSVISVFGANEVLYSCSAVSLAWKKLEWFCFSLHLSHRLLTILQSIYSTPWKVTVQNYFKIKSYAPHIDHLVFEVHCYPSE